MIEALLDDHETIIRILRNDIVIDKDCKDTGNAFGFTAPGWDFPWGFYPGGEA